MTDDPRDILKEAGVECPEVDLLDPDREAGEYFHEGDGVYVGREDAYRAAVLSLAILAVQFKWQRDAVLDRYVLTVEDEWGISHWRDDDHQPTCDEEYLSDEEAREKWKARVVADLGANEWDEIHA
jgi:hypothetical protein